MSALEFDYIVVGGGAAGCVLAGRLSESGKFNVALIEAGGKDSSPFIHIPGANIFAINNAKLNWNFESEPVAALNGRRIPLAQGKVVGGSSSINGMIFARGHSSDYDAWRDMGCAGWDFESLLPYFRKLETNSRGNSHWHGNSGPMHVGPANSKLGIIKSFLLAADQAGYPILDDLNSNAIEGFGYFDMNIYKGRRQSAARSYLGLKRSNLRIFSRTRATRIILDGKKATGIEAVQNGQSIVLKSRCEVILACGALNSPQLLMLSGLGPQHHLQSMGISVAMDIPALGSRLQNHPTYRMCFATKTPITAYKYLNPWHAAVNALHYIWLRKGFFSEGPFASGGFLRSSDDKLYPDIQVILPPALMIRHGPGAWGLMPREHGFTVLVNLGHSRSLGQVTLRSSDPLQPPAIDLNYFSDPNDLPTLASGVLRVRKILRQSALAQHISREIVPGPEAGDDLDALMEDIRQNVGTYYHYVGTCRMGSDENSVVDTQLRLRGIDSLRVADASIMPLLPNANTHAPTLMIAEKAADMILNAT